MPLLTNYDKDTHIFIAFLHFIKDTSIATTREKGDK
jgi:hypothetical protein